MNNSTLSTRQKRLGLTLGVTLMFAAFVDVHAAGASSLRPKQFKSFAQLQRVIAAKKMHNRNLLLAGAIGDTVFASGAENNTGASDFSDTNVQVEGVDEGDSIKTDGRFIYRLQNGKVQIVKAVPANALALTSEITFTNEFSPIEIYLRGNQLIVVGSGWHSDTSVTTPVPTLKQGRSMMLPIWAPSGESRTSLKVYDITDRSRPTLQREVEFSGNYITSRRIENNFYLVGRKYPNYFMNIFAESKTSLKANKRGDKSLRPKNILPRFRDTARNGGKERLLAMADLYYFPNFQEPDYTIVAGVNLDDPSQDADIQAYLGGGDIAYASTKSLYLSAADYPMWQANTSSQPFTNLYKFNLAGSHITFANQGRVPGVPLNQFSMDEHNDYFRIATTVDQWTQDGDNSTLKTWNNLYTLDSGMNIAGRLEHLADGERIFSSRFIGDRGYMVTFRQVDPLFVIDLSIPTAPKVLGELKIPGFSTYLHPFDQDHIIGFGQETTETDTGAVITSGLKLALFDVTDVTRPVQKHSLIIGDRGSYSPLLYDHKALMYDKKRGLLGFPVSVTEETAGQEWPSQVFQGAHLYRLTLAGGFKRLAAITHHQKDNNEDWYHSIQRLISIGGNIYTSSDARIQVDNIRDSVTLGALDFKMDYPVDGCVIPMLSDAASPAETSVAIDCPVLIDPVPGTVTLTR